MKKMHKALLLLVLSGFQLLAGKGDSTGTAVIKRMHKKYFHGPCKSYTFSQKNTHYRNDSVVGHSEWYEAIELPDKFRICFGEKAKGNFVVFKNDSAFNYKANKQVKQRTDSNMLLLLLGGMYYRGLENVLARLKNGGYNLSVLSEQVWNGRPVYVIGAGLDDVVSNQFWVDKSDLKVLRIIEKLNGKDIMDMRFETHRKSCRGFMETKVSFRRNGRLEQVEEYYDIKETENFQD